MLLLKKLIRIISNDFKKVQMMIKEFNQLKPKPVKNLVSENEEIECNNIIRKYKND